MTRDFAPVTLDALAALVPDGSLLALPPDHTMPAIAAIHALVRRGARDLRVMGVPVAGYGADILVGAGCVASLQTSAVSLGEYGFAPRFTAALKAGSIDLSDATCPCVHTALQAAEKGVPFLPLRGVIGSDILKNRPDWRVVDNPFANGDPILLVPAISPDVALFHARYVDRTGAVWIGRRRELATLAHASRTVLVTAEEIWEGELVADETMAPGTITSLYVSAVAVAPRGAWPLGCLDLYQRDEAHMAEYAREARDEAGFRRYLETYVLSPPARAAE